MSSLVYTRYELLRMTRNRRFFILGLIFPVVMYYAIAGAHKNSTIDGVSLPLYFLAGMISFGGTSSVLAGGTRIAMERSAGWTRQIRITPLSTRAYLRAKFLTAFVMALVSLILLTVAAVTLGVTLNAGHWLEMAGMILVGLVPYAVMGIAFGNLISADAMGPTQGGITALFSILGGSFGPLATTGVFHQIAELIPTYWIVQASHTLLGGHGWPTKAWVVILVWTVVMTRLAMFAFARASQRS